MKAGSTKRKTYLTAIFFFLLVLLGSRTTCWAIRYYIDITSPYFKKIPVAIPEFKVIGKIYDPGQQETADRLKSELPAILAGDLEFCGLFRILNPKGFLVDPQKMGLKARDINFRNWRVLGTELLIRGGFRVTPEGIFLELRLFDVVKAKMIVGRGYEASLTEQRHVIHKFAEETYKKLTGKPGIFLTKIAFVNKEGRQKRIYVCDFDGNNAQPIIKEGPTCLTPKWSPDGEKLAFVSINNQGPLLFVSDLTRGTVSKLCSYKGLNIGPAWHPKKKLLAVTLTVNGNPEIYTINYQGKIINRLTKFWGIDVSGSWSPDGRYLAYVSKAGGNPQVYILDTTSNEKKRLTFTGNYNTDPCWSPTGEWIAYSSLEKDGTHIYRIRPDGTDLTQLTTDHARNEHPSWSPDGRMLVFSSNRTGQERLWVMFANGTGQRQITFFSGEQSEPSWSPVMDR